MARYWANLASCLLAAILLGQFSKVVRSDSQYFLNGMGPVNSDWNWGTGRSEQYVAMQAYNGTYVWAYNDPGNSTNYPSRLLVGRTRNAPSNWFSTYAVNLNQTQEHVAVSTYGSTAIKSSIATNQNGTWLIAFSARILETDFDIYYIRSTDDGVTWSSVTRLDLRGASDTSALDDSPYLIYEPTGQKFWCAWLSNQMFTGPNGQSNSKGDVNVVVANSSDASGQGWSLAQYVNDNWQNAWDDEKSMTMFLGSPPGTIHIAFSTGAYANLGLAMSGYDFVIFTKNATSSTWANGRKLNPDQGRNVTNYSDEQYQSAVASDGLNVVFAYYRVLTQVWTYDIMVCVSRDGGWTFSEPVTVDSASPYIENGVTVSTDMQGAFQIIFTSRKSTYTFDNGAQVTISQGYDADIFYSVVTLPNDPLKNATITRPRPIDIANLLIPVPSSNNGDNMSPVAAADPVTGYWAAMFLSSKKNFKLNNTIWYTTSVPEFNVMATWWVFKAEELCTLNSTSIPAYCFQNLKDQVAAASTSSTQYTNIKVALVKNPMEKLTLDNGKWISITPAFSTSSWEIGSSFPNFEILDSASRLRYYGYQMKHGGASFFVQNTGGSNFLEIQPSNFSGFPCPLGFAAPPGNQPFCIPCPEGEVCSDRNSAVPTRPCGVGRYCPQGTYEDSLFKCKVFRYYNETGYISPSNCTTGGWPCSPGYYCPHGALASEHVLFVNLSNSKFDETVVFPSNNLVPFTATVFPNQALSVGNDQVYFVDERIVNPLNFPAWLDMAGTEATMAASVGGVLDLTATVKSKVAGVSIADTLRYSYALYARNSANGEDLMKPVTVDFSRTVTTVVFNPEEGITDRVSIYSGTLEKEMLIFNIGCESSLNWTAKVVNCTDPSYVLDWANTTTANGIIPVGSIDPAEIDIYIDLSHSILPGGQLYSQIAESLATANESPTPNAILGTRGAFTASACLDVRFHLLGLNSTNSSSELRKVLPIDIDLYETCPPGRFSVTGSSENGACVLCPSGSYAPDRGSTSCRSCPEELPRTVPGAVSHEDCEAAPGNFLDIDGKVLRCDALGAGVQCNNEGSTLATLLIKPGYWRSRRDSKEVFKCINQAFCKGNLPIYSRRRVLQQQNNDSLLVTNEYCIDNHLGPMCEGCVPNYVRRGLAPCAVCDDEAIAGDRMRLGWTLFAAVSVVVLAFLVVQWRAIVKFVKKRRETVMAIPRRISTINFSSTAVSGQVTSASSSPDPTKRRSRKNPAEFVRGMSTRMRASTKIDKRLTLLWDVVVSLEANMSIRILLSLFQVINGVSKTFYDLLPPGFHDIAAAFNIISAELFYRIDFGCILKSNHNLSLILSMAAPIIFTLLIVIIHFIMERRLKMQKRISDIEKLRNGSFSIFLLLLFLIYPGVSNTILSTFACREFDGGMKYLRTDLTVSCEAPDRHIWVALASFGVIIYVFGIPAFYTLNLWRVRKFVNPPNGEKPNPEKFPHVLFLTAIYKPKYFWWEVLELIRKLVQTSVIVFVVDGSLMQTIFMVGFTMFIVILLNELKPYTNEDANRLAYVAQWEILIVSFLTLLYRVDLTQIDQKVNYDKKTMLDVCVMAACFLAPVVALYQARKPIFKLLRFISHKMRNSCCLRRCCGDKNRTLALTVGSKIDEESGVEVQELGDRLSSNRMSSGGAVVRDAPSFAQLQQPKDGGDHA